MIYKILREEEYMALVVDGESAGAPIDVKDGFIHFSTAKQIAETLALHFTDESNLYLLAYDEKKLTKVKWEKSRGGDLFPHLYAPLKMVDVVESWPLDGHDLPKGLI